MDKLISNQVWIDLWLDKFIRWHLVSGLNGYMSYESIQTSLFQVWLNLKKNSLSNWNMSYIAKSELDVILAMFEWSNLFVLAWNFLCILYTYGIRCCENFMRIW